MSDSYPKVTRKLPESDLKVTRKLPENYLNPHLKIYLKVTRKLPQSDLQDAPESYLTHYLKVA